MNVTTLFGDKPMIIAKVGGKISFPLSMDDVPESTGEEDFVIVFEKVPEVSYAEAKNDEFVKDIFSHANSIFAFKRDIRISVLAASLIEKVRKNKSTLHHPQLFHLPVEGRTAKF